MMKLKLLLSQRANRSLLGLILMVPQLSLAQVGSIIANQRPNLAPGEKLSGKDHPELVPRRVAFQMLLHILSIQPEDAPYRQKRARLIEIKRIGLGTEDAAQLEQIIEEYRIREQALNYKVAQLRGTFAASHQDFVLQQQQHLNIMRAANTAINLRLTKEGRADLRVFLDEIISKSEIHSAASPMANGGTQ